MTIARHVKNASLALVALASLGALEGAYAVGTPSGTPITNTATLNYSVGNVSQTPITATAPPFLVDSRIDFTVTEVSDDATRGTPGASDLIATFRVTNTGNSTQGYLLTVVNQTAGGAALFDQVDNQDVANLRRFVDDGDRVYDDGDIATDINSLATDADGESVLVFVVADIPVAASNNQYANVRLTARAAEAGLTVGAPVMESGLPDVPGTIDVVFADAGRDATEFALDQYAIISAVLTATKAASVVSDPVNAGSDPKAIPGAVVEYRIQVTNSSTTTAATNVTFTDDIPANTTYVPGSMTLNGTALTDDGSDSDGGEFQEAPTPRVVVTAAGIAARGERATVTFRVTINNRS
jgi:uncharacterized repeat protein (TIGR01451 family)